MIVGIGLDIVAVERIARPLGDGDGGFEALVFTQAEREACQRRVDRAQALAARFAAKEACLKALGTGLKTGMSFQQVEVLERSDGRPELRLSGAAAERAQALGVRRVLVSLSHEREVAAAAVVLEA